MPINNEQVQTFDNRSLNGHAPDASMLTHGAATQEIAAIPAPMPPAPLNDYGDPGVSYPPANPQLTLKLPAWRMSYRTFNFLIAFMMLVTMLGFLGFQYAQTVAIRTAYTATAPGPGETWISITPTQVTALTVPTPRGDNKVYFISGGWTVVTPKNADAPHHYILTGTEQGNYLSIDTLDGRTAYIYGFYKDGNWELHFAPSGMLTLHLAGGADYINAIAPWQKGGK